MKTRTASTCTVAILLLSSAACSKRNEKVWVERVEVEGDTVADNAVMALTPAQVQSLLSEQLGKHGSFVIPREGQKPTEGARQVRLAATLEFTREAQKEGRTGTYAEVGATLLIKPRGEMTRYEVVGLGEVKITGESLDERQDAVRQALKLALSQLVDSTQLMLSAVGKADAELVKDLEAKDPRLREFALRVLSDRGHPAAAEPLLSKLESDDGDEVRRAIGGLVELKDPRAVPALIDLARAKDTVFLKEIVFALGAIGGEEAQAYLYTVAQGHDHPEIRASAEQALKEMESRGRRSAKAPPTESGGGKE